MTSMHCYSARRAAALLAGAFGIAMMASAAQAFTFNDQPTGSNSDNAAKFSDPVERSRSRLNSDGTEKPRIQSGPTFQFGGRETFDQRNNSDRYFNPNNLMGR